jgi:hypothetical protein
VKRREYQEVLEECILQVARRFVANGGEGALNLCYEAEIEVSLFGRLRRLRRMKVCDKEGHQRELVHLHWPCVKDRYIDLVVWHPDDIDLYREDWEDSFRKKGPSRRLLAAMQIKLGPGEMPGVNDVGKDLKDLQAIGRGRKNRQTQLYFVGFADCKVREGQSKDRYGNLKRILEGWCKDDPGRRRALLLSKDKVGFTCPPDGWGVAPIKGVITELPE